MQKMTILCTGKLKEKFYLDAVAEYVKRLNRFCKLEIIELPEERLPENPSPAQIEAALSKEADAVRAKLPNGCLVIAMCVEGRERSSEELARYPGEDPPERLPGGPVRGGQAPLQPGAGPAGAHLAGQRRPASGLCHRRLLRSGGEPEKGGQGAPVHVPHDLSPPPAAGNAFGADLPGLPDQCRKPIP